MMEIGGVGGLCFHPMPASPGPRLPTWYGERSDGLGGRAEARCIHAGHMSLVV